MDLEARAGVSHPIPPILKSPGHHNESQPKHCCKGIDYTLLRVNGMVDTDWQMGDDQ